MKETPIEMSDKSMLFSIRSMTFFNYFVLGAFMPLLTYYLQQRGLTGGEIGILSALGPVVILLVQPFWGMLADRYQIQKRLLYLAAGLMAAVALLFPHAESFLMITFMVILINLFQAPLIPFTDSFILQALENKKIPYGNIRLWGSLGFAAAVLAAGRLTEVFSIDIVFYITAISLLLLILSVSPLPSVSRREVVSVFAGVGQLLRKGRFLLFLMAAFFIFGPINANNFYFNLYFQEIGGSIAGVGLVFFLSAVSEIPFLRIGGWIIGKLGTEVTLLIASLVSLLRWVLFLLIRDPFVITLLFFLQGISVGFYLASAPQFVNAIAPRKIRASALTLYAAFGNGLGTVVTNLAAGWILDRFSSLMIYTLLSGMTILGFLTLIGIMLLPAGAAKYERT